MSKHQRGTKDFQVLHRASQRLEQTVFSCNNIIDARNKFARKKGYEDWGSMVAAFRDNRSNDLQKPPYIFRLANK